MPDEDHEHFYDLGPTHETPYASYATTFGGLVDELAELLEFLEQFDGATLGFSRLGACAHWGTVEVWATPGVYRAYLPTGPLLHGFSDDERVSRLAQLASWGWSWPEDPEALCGEYRSYYEGEVCGMPMCEEPYREFHECQPYLSREWVDGDANTVAHDVLTAFGVAIGRDVVSRYFYEGLTWKTDDEESREILLSKSPYATRTYASLLASFDSFVMPAVGDQYRIPLTAVLLRMKTDERLGIGCGPGWFPLIIETDRRLSDLDPGYQVVQLKAKWGELRYYIQTSPSAPDETRGEMFNVTKQALERSRHICEHCGGPIEVEITETGGTSTWGCPRCFGDRGCRTDWPGRP